MRDAAEIRPLANLIEGCWPGEWGSDPIDGKSNCIVYRATDIDDHGHVDVDGGAARLVDNNKIARKAMKGGDILLEASGGSPEKPVGRVALFSDPRRGPALVSNFFRVLRPKAEVDARFLTYQLVALHQSSAILRYQQQTTGLINLKVSDYLLHSLWAPGVEVQRKIAAILTSLDTAVEKTEALIAKHQQIKAGLMHDLFTRGVLPNGALRPGSDSAPGMYVTCEIGPVSHGWSVVPAGQLCSLITKGTTPASEDMFEEGDGIRFLRVDNLTFDGTIDLTASAFRVSRTTHRTTLARSRCVPGDVLTNIVGPPLGKVGLVLEAHGEVNINQAIAVFRPGPRLLPEYLLGWLTGETAKRWLLARSKQTSGQINFTLAMCQELPVPMPPLDEQRLIVQRQRVATAAIESETVTLAKLRLQKRGLMHALLSGPAQ
jgi:type I restriction enzyme S subunit